MSTNGENEATTRAFFATWEGSFDSMVEGFRRYLAEDCLFKQTRLPDLHGLKEIIPFLELVRSAGLVERMKVEVWNVVSDGNKIAFERTDTSYLAEGEAEPNARFPAASFMEIKDGKITQWRDYFDSADFPAGGLEVIHKKWGSRLF